jgi:hypothetical protein
MKPNAITTPPEPTEAEIQHTAYLLWLEGGREPDRDLEYWFAAKELLRHHHAPGAGHKHRVVSPIPPAILPVKAVPAKAKR